jgi:hypothetical protein
MENVAVAGPRPEQRQFPTSSRSVASGVSGDPRHANRTAAQSGLISGVSVLAREGPQTFAVDAGVTKVNSTTRLDEVVNGA